MAKAMEMEKAKAKGKEQKKKIVSTGKYTIPIMLKGMEVMELISEHPQGLTIQEMVNNLKHSKTSVYRIVCSFEEMGYLRKEEVSGRFSLTRKFFKLGLSTLGTATIIEHAYEPMRQLRDSLRETVVLGTLVGNKVVILEQIVGSHLFSFMLKPGMEVSLHTSAPGKAMLAHLDPEESDTIIETLDFKKYNANTIGDPNTLKRELKKARKRGFALDWGEELAGVHCIGAPIFNQAGKVAAAVWITGPAERLPEEVLEDYGRQVADWANVISQKIGYRN